MTRKIISILLVGAASAWCAGYRAGTARVKITPTEPIWLSGYANRSHPSDGVLHDLWVKALAIQGTGKPVVVVTVDLIGVPRELTDEVASEVHKRLGIERSHLLFNASHTHTSPVVWPMLARMFVFPPGEEEKLRAYERALVPKFVDVISQAVSGLAPAEISLGFGQADFAGNRRKPTPRGVANDFNPDGVTDHTVPVLRVRGPDGKPIAVLFGYACHNTTLSFYQISADYAGFTQTDLEEAHPGVNAMFMELCGADQNPYPRSTVELAQEHGKQLAAAVDAVLAGAMQPVSGGIRTSYLVTKLAFAPQTRATFEEEARSRTPSNVNRAQDMLRAIDAGHPVVDTPYPVQAIRFGKSLTLLALGGETVVGYGLRAKKEFPGEPLIVAGYSNDVMCYIPTRQILQEGGYEPVASMVYYDKPGPFASDVEDRIFTTIHQAMRAVGR